VYLKDQNLMRSCQEEVRSVWLLLLLLLLLLMLLLLP